jgi:hypothetical protein
MGNDEIIQVVLVHLNKNIESNGTSLYSLLVDEGVVVGDKQRKRIERTLIDGGLVKYADTQTTGYNDDLVFLSFTGNSPSEKPRVKTENTKSANATNWAMWKVIVSAIGIVVSIIIFILSL